MQIRPKWANHYIRRRHGCASCEIVQCGEPAAYTRLNQLLTVPGSESAVKRLILRATPSAPDRFVAALYIRGDELLVVAGHHPSPALLSQRLQQQAFRDFYLDLQATPTPAGHGNGIRTKSKPTAQPSRFVSMASK